MLGALLRPDDFLMNPLIQGLSGTTPETSRNAYGRNEGTNEEDSQSDLHPEAGVFPSQTTRNSGPEIGRDMVTRVNKKVTFCSPCKISGKPKNNHSTSQPQFHSENTPATNEADPILLALQQLANNNNLANFHNNINRNSKLPNHSPQQSQRLTGNLRSLSCLKIFSKRATIS